MEKLDFISISTDEEVELSKLSAKSWKDRH